MENLNVEIGKLDLKEGNLLVVKMMNKNIPHEVIAKLRDDVEKYLPKGVKCLVFDSNCEISTYKELENGIFKA
jgi:hypothetical protein